MTKVGDHQLRVDMEDWDGNARYALYNTFNVGDTLSKYKLSINITCIENMFLSITFC
jgi:angiopoietin 2/deleted-in-malignant-brain-tumors protein 1/collagen type V/XI/XXIV/XXVII alpha